MHSWVADFVVATASGVFAYFGEDTLSFLKVTAPTTTDPDDDVDPDALRVASNTTDQVMGISDSRPY